MSFFKDDYAPAVIRATELLDWEAVEESVRDLKAIRAAGGSVVGAACLIDRSSGKAKIGVKLASLTQLSVPAYEADKLPPELAAIPAVKPGSRGLK